jgi:hypothetical protein
MIEKLAKIMDKLREVRGGNDFILNVVVARQFPKLRRVLDVHIITSNGKHEPLTSKWKAIGHLEGQQFADEEIKKEWRDDMTIRDFAKLGYRIIKQIEDEKIDPSIGVGDEEPNIRYLENGKEMDEEATPEELQQFEECYSNRLDHLLYPNPEK